MPTLIPHTIRIRLSNAQHVAIVGDFNNWHSSAHPLTKVGTDLWERIIDLPPGSHRYAFFVIERSTRQETLRSQIFANGSILYVPDSTDQAISITAHPALASHTVLEPTIRQVA